MDSVEEKELIVKYQQYGCIESRNKIFLSLTTAIKKQVIKKVWFLDRDTIADFVHDCYVAVIRAISKYKLKSTARLKTYIYAVVNNEIKRLLSSNAHRLIRTPVLRSHNSKETQERIKNIHSVSYFGYYE